MSMTLEMSKTQSQILMAKQKHVGAFLGFGFGKTFVICTALIMDMLKHPTANYLWLAPTYILLRDIFYAMISEMLTEIGLRYKINKSENIVHVQGHGLIYCRTMDRPEMIIGISVFKIFMDELDVLPTDKAHHVYKKASARLRQQINGEKNQIFVASTPEGFKAGYQLFKKDPLEDSILIQGSTYENQANLPDDYISDLKSQYPDQLIEAYLNGQFVNLVQGTVYYSFDRKKHATHYVVKPREALHVGMDFNVYNGAAAICIIRDGIPYVVDEFTGVRDTPDMIEALKQKYAEHHITIYPDASGDNKSSKSATVSDITLLHQAGFVIRVKPANPMIKDRVQSVNKCLEDMALFVNPKCTELSEALEQQVYNEKTGMPDKTSGLDHILDAIGYLIHYKWPIVRNEFRSGRVVGNY